MMRLPFSVGREARLVAQRVVGNFGLEGFRPRPEMGVLPEHRLPPEIAPRYAATLGRLNGVMGRMDANRLSPEAIAIMRLGMVGRYPDGMRPMWPVLRESNMVSPYLSQSRAVRVPWTFVPSGWRMNQPAFIPGVGLGLAPYGVPPTYRPMLYSSVPYPLPNAPYRLPSLGRSPFLRPADPLLWDRRTAFAPIPRPPLLPPPPPDPRRLPVSPLSVPVSAYAASYAAIGSPAPAPLVRSPDVTPMPGRASIQFTYDGPSQAIILSVDGGRQLPVAALPADGQTIRDPQGFTISRQGNQYLVSFTSN